MSIYCLFCCLFDCLSLVPKIKSAGNHISYRTFGSKVMKAVRQHNEMYI